MKDARYLSLLLALGTVYIAAGKLGLLLASVNASVSPVWPPTGIAIAALLLYGLRLWPAVLVGAFVVNVTTSGHVPSSIGIAVGNTLEALTAAWLTVRFAGGARAFLHGATVFRYAFLAALVSTAISATVGAGTLVAAGLADTAELGAIWFTWWFGDAGGALVVAPPIVLWLSRVPPLRHGGDRVELVGLAAAVVVTFVFLFTPLRPFQTSGSPAPFIALPVLVWAAFRFGPRIASTVLVALAMFAAWAVANGSGPLATATPNDALLFVQGATAVASVMTLALAASVLERQESEEQLRRAEAELLQAEERKVAERDEFLGIAAHELRTPLTSLQLAVEILQREAASPEGARRSLQVVGSRTARLGQLVGQLLDTVRIETGRFALEVADDEVSALVLGAVAEAQAGTDRHQILLNAPAELRARVDALRLEQVLRNLLDNAVKFSPSGGRIDVDLGNTGGRLRLSV
ncbi:MAG TPA: MASE1 domain-containing protein, partial [Thermoanaerobaculia bacterium]|nr:MASE1 domain-containing protein [Thermoanaerobaculia bacterium]